MIKDIPTGPDFQQRGVDFLHLAWDAILDLHFNAAYSGVDLDEESGKEYWNAVEFELTSPTVDDAAYFR